MEAVGSGQRSAMIVWPDLPFTSHTARSLGASPDQLTEAVANSELVRVLTGVYLRADIPLDLVAKSRCAALVVTPHSVLCDRTAAWIHGIDVLRYAELDVVPPVESYVLRGHHPTDRSECAGGTRDLLPEDWMDVHGLRVTTPLRTALDLACKLPRREALAALDAFVRTHGITHRDLHVLLRRLPAQTGSRPGAHPGPAGRRQVRVPRRDVDASGDQGSGAAVAHAAVLGARARDPDIPPRPGVPPCPHRHRVRRGGVPLQPERSRP